jgi:hypothetical protein
MGKGNERFTVALWMLLTTRVLVATSKVLF